MPNLKTISTQNFFLKPLKFSHQSDHHENESSTYKLYKSCFYFDLVLHLKTTCLWRTK